MRTHVRSLSLLGLLVGGLIGVAVAKGKFLGAEGKSQASAAADEKAPPPGSPAATRAIDGKQIPPADPKFGGKI